MSRSPRIRILEILALALLGSGAGLVWTVDAVAHTFGIDNRPPYPDCVAFPRPATPLAVDLGLVEHFPNTATTTITNLIQSPVDPDVWYGTPRGDDHKADEIGLIYRYHLEQDPSLKGMIVVEAAKE